MKYRKQSANVKRETANVKWPPIFEARDWSAIGNKFGGRKIVSESRNSRTLSRFIRQLADRFTFREAIHDSRLPFHAIASFQSNA